MDAVIEHYLEHTKMTRAATTYASYSRFLVEFSRFLNRDYPNLLMAELKAIHVSKYRYSLADRNYSTNTLHGIIRTIKTCFAWAADQGLTPTNPVAKVEMPIKTNREIIVTEAQWKAVMHYAKGEGFRDLLVLYRRRVRGRAS